MVENPVGNEPEILNQMIDRAHARRERWETREVPQLPGIEQIKETAILGTFSVNLMVSKVRMLQIKTLIPLNGVSETPSAIARDYLVIKYGSGPKVHHYQAEILKEAKKGAPQYSKPIKYNHGFYIDLEATYWSIMLRTGWDVDYWPGRWLRPGTPPEDFPFPEKKLARNCLVSAGVSNKVPIYKMPDEEVVTVPHGNQVMNYSLFVLINDLLNCIAGEVKEVGAVYVNSDGYIAPNPETAARIFEVLNTWGLPARVKAEGYGGVTGPGVYKVGKVEAAFWETRNRLLATNAIANISYARWLKRAWQEINPGLG